MARAIPKHCSHIHTERLIAGWTLILAYIFQHTEFGESFFKNRDSDQHWRFQTLSLTDPDPQVELAVGIFGNRGEPVGGFTHNL
jgi:hypothetical protein